MISEARKKVIRKLARRALVDHNSLKLPVRPIAFAEDCLDMAVMGFDPPAEDISGFLMRDGNSFGIGYSQKIKSVGFRHFTVAHEIGHYFIDGHVDALLKNGTHLSKSGFISNEVHEREADIFASEFLMPWKLIEEIVRSKNGFAAIKTISDQCLSSRTAAAIRYASTSEEIVAVIVSHNGIVEFMYASPLFSELPGVRSGWLKRGMTLPEEVKSAELGIDEEWISQCEKIETGSKLSKWFPKAPNLDLEEDIVGLGSYGRLMTVLFSEASDMIDSSNDAEDDDEYIDRWEKGHFRSRK